MAEHIVAEEWRPVVGWEGFYEVSKTGRVRTIRDLSQWTCGGGRTKYPAVTLCRNKQSTNALVHVLVAEAFHGARPFGKVVNHKDGNKSNNSADNLEWITQTENVLHSTRVLGNNTGERNGMSKLTAPQVDDIRRLKRQGVRNKDIAEMYGIHAAYVSLVSRRTTWKHV